MRDHHVLTPGYLPASHLPGLAFPSFPAPLDALAVTLLAQLAETQWWSPAQLRAAQLRQLEIVARHAATTTRYGRQAWAALAEGPLTWERWSSVPLLPRRTVQAKRRALLSERLPPDHKRTDPARTSGSTGTPVVVDRTEITHLVWQVQTARDHLWHRRDTRLPLAVVRYAPGAEHPHGADRSSWGPAADLVGPPGPSRALHITATTEQQLEWLLRRDVGYLLHYPSGLADLVQATRRRGVRLPGLKGVRTFGEPVTPELRDEIQGAWGVGVVDMYSTQELGYLALQCPDHPHLHVQSESVVLEVLREDGSPCAIGETGRVVATSLHNLAMPLLRYDLGDQAVLGPPCPCGRGLPVIERVLGRVHQTFVTADGDRIWLVVGVHRLRDLAPVAQHQFVQKATDHLELRLVPSRPPRPDEEEALRAYLLEKLPAGVRVTLTWVDEIPRAPGGKFLDFISEIG